MKLNGLKVENKIKTVHKMTMYTIFEVSCNSNKYEIFQSEFYNFFFIFIIKFQWIYTCQEWGEIVKDM